MSEKLQNYISTFIMASYNNPDMQISRKTLIIKTR